MISSGRIAASKTVKSQSCAIPFRWRANQLEFCLITSANKGHWIFPKGGVETGDTLGETALKEAHEEAGLLGHVIGEPLGEYRYIKNNSLRHVTVFLMSVAYSKVDWQEADRRIRRWAQPSAAKQLLLKPELTDFLEIAVRQLRNPKSFSRSADPVAWHAVDRQGLINAHNGA